MSSEYFPRTSLYLVRLKIFEWIKFLRRYLHQIPENCAGRNFITALRVNSQLIMQTMQECRDESEIYYYQHIQLSNKKFMNGIVERGDAWPGLTVNL